MENGECAYKTLGVTKSANQNDIKKAYRKMALKYHPDKQTTEEDRQKATGIFVKISNAYEILSDSQKRQEYDMGKSTSNNNNNNNSNNNSSNTSSNSNSSSQRPSAGDEFFSNARAAGRHPFEFHDPFEIFNRVFREEFSQHQNQHQNLHQNQHQYHTNNHNPGMGMGGSFRGGSNPSGASPFSSMMPMMGGGSLFDDPFFGGGGGMGGMPQQQQQQQHHDPFAMMQQSMMMNGGGGVGTNGTTSSFSTSSSTSSGGGGGMSTSTSSTTRIVNGRRQTVRETIIQRPDGTVERKVETDGEPTQHLGDRRRSSQINQLSNQQLAETAAPDRKKAKKRGSSHA